MANFPSFTGDTLIAAGDYLVGYAAAAAAGDERRWSGSDLASNVAILNGTTAAEMAYLSGVTSGIQDQLGGKIGNLRTLEANFATAGSPNVITAAETGKILTNEGATVVNYHTLPTAAAGLFFSFIVEDAAGMRIVAATGDTIRVGASVSAAAGYLESTAAGDHVTLVAINAVEWVAISVSAVGWALDGVAIGSGGGAFEADANTQITPSTAIVLDQATGNEAALSLDYTTNKLTSGDDTGLLINQTDTLSPGTSKLIDAQVGGVSKFSVSNGGAVSFGTLARIFQDGGVRIIDSSGGDAINVQSGRTIIPQSAYLGWGNVASITSDLRLLRDAANALGQRNGVNAQTYNIYNTYTDASNYERAHIGWNDTGNTFVIGTEAAGTGVVRDIQIKIGADRVFGVDTTLFNTSVGEGALGGASLTGTHNVATGPSSLSANTSGNNNVASGFASLYSNTTGSNNIATGTNSLRYNTTGNYNVASGYNSLYSNTTGNYNIASGYNSLFSNTTGNDNIAFGEYSLVSNTTGSNNIASGNQAGRYQSGGTTTLTVAENSVFLGATTKGVNLSTITGTTGAFSALINNASVNIGDTAVDLDDVTLTGIIYQGNSFTVAGDSQVYRVTATATASANAITALAFEPAAKVAWADNAVLTVGSSVANQVVIGDTAESIGANTVVLGNDSIVTTALKGNVGIGTTTPATTLDVNGGVTLNTTTVNAATYDLLVTDYLLHVTYTTTGAVTSLTLPTAQTTAGRTIVIKDSGGNATTNNITVDTEAAQTIDGAATLVIDTDYASVTLCSDGTNWLVI